MYQVLLIEDDIMVQTINKQYIEQLDEFQVTFLADCMPTALDILEKNQALIDIIFIDDNLGGKEEGISYIGWIKQKYPKIELVVVSANSSKEAIQSAYNLGASDYILKPFNAQRLHQSLENFKLRKLRHHNKFTQTDIDDHYQPQNRNNKKILQWIEKTPLEKGISFKTLQHILLVIQTYPNQFSINQLSRDGDLSHVTIRHYINFLVDKEYLTEEIVYQKNGRPYSVYRVCC